LFGFGRLGRDEVAHPARQPQDLTIQNRAVNFDYRCHVRSPITAGAVAPGQ
jgi:hypothetical protein